MDLFCIIDGADVCSFADATTLYACDMSLSSVHKQLEHNSLLAIEWFEANYMKLNAEKCHLLVAGTNMNGCGFKLETIGNHVANICKRANHKLTDISRHSKFLSFDKTKASLTAFGDSQFVYCLLDWMLNNRKANSKVNRVQ